MALMNIEESLDFAAADRFLLVRFFLVFLNGIPGSAFSPSKTSRKLS